MFKSVFTKYISVFVSIVIVSFLLLAVIMTSMVSRYSYQAKQTLIETTAQNTVESIYAYMRLVGGDFAFFSNSYGDELQKMFDRNAQNAQAVIFLTDISGNILTSSTAPSDYFCYDAVPPDVMSDLMNGSKTYGFSNMGGLFRTAHTNYFFMIKVTDSFGTEEVTGALFLTSATPQMAEGAVTEMSRTILISILWISLAALIATYIISEHITRPLKQISRAAKEYASGNFNVRVPVHGKDEIAELCETFNNMADSLSRQEDMRNTFLANISHDLRTPMTSIAGFIDGILDGAIPLEKQSYYLSLIASEVRRLSRLVSSLLDISRMQAGDRKFTPTAFDICESARQILLTFEKRVDEKHLQVEFDCDHDNIMVYADADAIHQVLYNLCDNAVKFARENGELRVSIHEKGKKALISVYNTGDGIPEKDLPNVFERFYKSDPSRGLDKTGVGLGLFIAKTIITQHGEEIAARSQEGEYCEMAFTLTRAYSAPAKQFNQTDTED